MSRIDLPGYGIETAPAGPRAYACAVCGEDGIPLEWNDLSDEHLCERCKPREGELCEAYLDRCHEIRRAA